jgi:arginyl-tRNA synthetase
VRFDHWLGESAYQPMLAGVVEDLVQRGLAVESRGAQVIFLDEEKLPPFLVKKGDGGYNYATTDIATMAVRTGVPPWPHMPAGPFDAQRVIIVTDERQQLHFKQLFAVARRLGVPAQLDHVWFGLMRLPEGTIKTRSAGSSMIYLDALLDEAERRAYAVASEKAAAEERPLDEAALREVARVVGLGAVKYNDLSRDRQTLVTFTWDKALALTGNTAPYLQYAYARIRSIVRKTEAPVVAAPISLGLPVERDLCKRLLAYPEAVDSVGRTLRPHLLAEYLYDLATGFSTFYAEAPVLKAEPELRASRLLLTELVSRVLAQGLGLLGIEVLERM